MKNEMQLQIIDEQVVLDKNFKVYGTFENPLFLAKDVAEWIEHSDTSKMVRNIDEDEKVTNIVRTLGGNQECLFLTEDGLYEVLMQSRKPIAKQFKKEVKKILKDLRLKGNFNTSDTTLSTLQAIKELANTSMIIREEQLRLSNDFYELNTQVETLQDVISDNLDWNKAINKNIKDLAKYIHLPYPKIYNQIYNKMERNLHISLSNRLKRHRKRMKSQGCKFTDIQKFGKIHLIQSDPKLRYEFDKLLSTFINWIDTEDLSYVD